MRASWSITVIVWTLFVIAGAFDSREAPPLAKWDAPEEITYNSTGNMTAGGGGNATADHNATIPMPNNTRVPSPTTKRTSDADFPFTAKTTAMTLAVFILLLAA